MASPELDRLIVEHLGDIDAAAKRLHALQGEVGTGYCGSRMGQKEWVAGQIRLSR